MQIGLDLRFLDNSLYSKFVMDLVIKMVKINEENNYIIYTNNLSLDFQDKFKEISKKNNVEMKNTGINNFSIKEQTTFLKILKNDKNNLVLFFNHFKPIFYTGEYYIYIPSLKDVYYGNFDSIFNKYKYLFLLEKNLKKSRKVLCFDENTKNELIERFDLNEDKIFLNEGFFIEDEIHDLEEHLKIDIKSKHGIKNDYFIYSGGDGIEKNIDKLVWAFTKIDKDIDLVILGDEISKNISLRNLIIEYKLQNKIKFLSPIKKAEKYLIYKQSKGVIFPSLYETFPFHLGEALNYNVPILASNLKSIKNIFSEGIDYFSPISKSNLLENINIAIENNSIQTDYEIIKKRFFVEKSATNLLEIIK